MDDLVRTIDSDAENVPNEDALQFRRKKGGKMQPEEGVVLNPDFTFDPTGDVYQEAVDARYILQDDVKIGSKPRPISVDDIISQHKAISNAVPRKRKREEYDEGEDSSEAEEGTEAQTDSMEQEEPSESSSEEGGVEEEAYSDYSLLEEETLAEKERKAAFFASETPQSPDIDSSFLTMNLSRPILKALTSLSFHKPTPIQARTIPAALLGKDIVGNAVTGSGKTAAFMIPILERLLYRDKSKKAAAIRCLVLVPTRELGVQCFEVATKLAIYADIRSALVVGGLSLKAQENTLRSRPDILIATPGRLIDHLRNSPTFNLDNLDILVLDEADRMLSDGFADELTEIVKSCPRSRQTMLFSATMTDSVDELIKMSLDKPVRLFVDPRRATATGLIQEFVRVKAGREAERAPLLVTLCKRTFKERAIIFFRSKKLAHQMRILFGLLDLKAGELHGNLTQEQRLVSLQQFRDGKVDYLMATDLASRGLDIKGVETVINYDMPGQLEQYLHRVGRTARAGRNGRSVTLVGEADRKLLKAAIKHSGGEDKIRHRVVPPEIVEKWAETLNNLEEDVKAILQEEQEAKQMQKAEMEIRKGENMVKHEEEIYSRPARTWFQSSKEKAKAADISRKQYEAGFHDTKENKKEEAAPKPKRDKFSGLSRKAKRRKLAQEQDAELQDGKAILASIRGAKKSQRPTKIGEPEAHSLRKTKRTKNSKKRDVAKLGKGLGFARDASDARKREGARARKSDSFGRPKAVSRKKTR